MRWRWHRVLTVARHYLGRSCGQAAVNLTGIPDGTRCDLPRRHPREHMAGPTLFGSEMYIWPAHPAGSAREPR